MEDKKVIKNENKKITTLSKKEKCQQLVKSFPIIDKNILQEIENEWSFIKEQAENRIMNTYFSNPKEINIWVHKFYELELGIANYIDKHKLIENKEIENLTLDEVLVKLTFFIRQERFCTGLVASRIKDGTIEKLIKRLNELTQ
ncbi:MAG: hypothetical protein HFJ24_03255 [Clostridia bacterium]|nr:hypothetical protein [Clostridia bacterium]